MSSTARTALAVLVTGLPLLATGCQFVPQHALRQSQTRSWQLAHRNRQLSNQAAQTGQLAQDLNTANQQIANLQNERGRLHQRYTDLMKTQSPLSAQATRRLEQLKNKYPGFDFDPATGVSKFGDDILFNSGAAALNNSATPVLNEFARIMNDGGADELNILVVGHTDDRRIARVTTRSKHETNWHLSTNRANAVVLALKKFGIDESRLGSAGYGANQPVLPNTDNKSRAKNRRVEIFVLAPDAVVAGWDPPHRRQ